VVRTATLLILVFALSIASLSTIEGSSLAPLIWPAGGVAAGLYLTTRARARPVVLVAIFAVVLVAHLIQGMGPGVSLGFSLTCAATVWVLRRLLVRAGDTRRAALLEPGEVSRLIGAITMSSAVAALGYAATDLVTGHGNPGWGALGAFGAYAAALMVLLPLFLRTIDFAPLAGNGERATQAVILVGTAFLVFWPADIPPVFFALMPMFAWYAYRGSLREATILLAAVGTIGTVLTMAGVGPLHGMQLHYDLPPEAIHGVFQLFLLDCGIVLLPLSVMTTQQRMSAGRADAESSAMRQLVSSATGTAIIATGRDGTIEVFNPAAERMFDWSVDEVLGGSPDVLMPHEERARLAAELGVEPTFEQLCRACVERGLGTRSWSFVRCGGEVRTMRITPSILRDELGAYRGFLATAEDVTEREARQRALLETLEHQRIAVVRLQELERTKGDFVATVSHELRTPITTILGYSEVLADGMVGELTEGQAELVNRLERNGRRLLQLVEDLLSLSMIEASSARIEPVNTDICDVARAARAELEAVVASRAVDVEVELPEHAVLLSGDPVQLQRMLGHLLVNAVKFTPDGGRVQLCVTAGSDGLSLVVRDNGIGISARDQEKLFTRFFRSRAATDMAVQGTGLGLTIVHSVVSLHGGSIDVESELGEGTSVTVWLPYEQSPATAHSSVLRVS
jgi:PAS domain S-box-containing protein